MRICYSIFLLCVAAFVAHGARRNGKLKEDCPANAAAREKHCPLLLGAAGRRSCFKMFSSERGGAFTLLTAKGKCATLGGHLANILDRASFRKIRCYIRETTTLTTRDSKVLLGMEYNTRTRKIRLADSGLVVSRIYWGAGRPLSYGSSMVLRAHKRFAQSRIVNFGGRNTRYDRILCEYPPK